MTDTLARQLAARFTDDAQALRDRAAALSAPNARRGHGPDAAACRAMADACDRVSALFAGATDDALDATIPQLERLLADERAPDVKHVYAGAIARLRQTTQDDDDEDEDDDDDDE